MIRSLIYHVYMPLCTGLAGGLSILFAPFVKGPAVFDWVHRWWGNSILSISGVKLQVEGLEHIEPYRPYVIIANHQSFFDIWALAAGLPQSVRFVAKGSLGKVPLLGSGMRAIGHVIIDRKSRKAAISSIRAARSRAEREGHAIVWFAEGTRSRDGKLARFKRGVFGLAIETGLPMVPVAIEGGFDILGPGEKRLRPGIIRVTVTPPIPADEMKASDANALMARAHRRIATALGTGD